MAELLEKIPVEKRWEITSKTIWRFFSLRGEKLVIPLFGMGEDIISPIMAWEKYDEINVKIASDSAKQFYPWVKETFNIPVEDAIGAAKVLYVATALTSGPELECEIVEATPERTVFRTNKCPWWESSKEAMIDPELHFPSCAKITQAMAEAGLKASNPNINYRLRKTMLEGEPYCEAIIEFKVE